MTLTRRALLRAAAGAGLASAAACVLPDRAGPRILHATYPMGPMPAPRGGPGRTYVGAAKLDITPPEGSRVWLAGYGFQRPMGRLHDAIEARAIYLDDGVRRVALVVADVVGLTKPSVDRVRRLVGNGVEVVVASTHNHQSPDTMGYWGPAILHAVPSESGIDVGYHRILERRLAAVVHRAAAAARPAHLGVTRVPLPGGWVRNLRDPRDVPSQMTLVEARAIGSGAVITSLVNFGCHPETLGPRGDLLSADFPAPLRAEIESVRGGLALFVNGALGGMLTVAVDDGAELDERLRFVTDMGRAVGAAAAEGLAAMSVGPQEAVAYHGQPVELPVDNDLYRFLERRGLVEPHLRGPSGGAMTEVARLDLGPWSFAVVPGEPTPLAGRQMQDALLEIGREAAGVIGLGNDELGYLLTEAQFDDPAFSYEVSVSPGRRSVPLLINALSSTQAKSPSGAS